jgi:CelD/BcsL family acetyltransferase involved in cellulose biosynthesis
MASSPRAELLGADDVSELVAAWDALAERRGLPYCSPHWLLPWGRHVAPERRLRCVAVSDGGELIGLAPFFEGRERGVRTLRLASVYGSGAPKAPRAASGREREVAAAVARCLAAASPRPRLIAIDGVPSTSPWARGLAAGWQPPGRAYREFSRPLTWIDVEGRSFDEWLDAKGAKTRKNVRRLRRRLEEQGATFRVATTAEDIVAGLGHFRRLHLAQWDARGGSAVVTDGTEAMLREAAGELAGRSRFWVASIELDGETIASEVFVRAGEVAADWLGGFDEAWGRFSPGMLVMMAGIEHATQLHVSRVEFGAGRQPFKHRLSDGTADLDWAFVVPPGAGSMAATSLTLVRVGRRRGAAAARDVAARVRSRGAPE